MCQSLTQIRDCELEMSGDKKPVAGKGIVKDTSESHVTL